MNGADSPRHPQAAWIRRLTAGAVIGVLGIYLGYTVGRSSAPHPSHAFVALDGGTRLIWERPVPPTATSFPVADSRHVYMATSDTQRLLAFDALTGETVWSVALHNEQKGIRQLIADGSFVFALTATRITAYTPTLGKQLWSLRLGDGHVRVLGSDLGETIAVLYGDSFMTVLKHTGEVVENEPLGNLLWPSRSIRVFRSAGGMAGLDPTLGNLLWDTTSPPFVVTEHLGPQEGLPSSLIAFNKAWDLCAFDLSVGSFDWCIGGDFISNPGVSNALHRVYVLKSDFDLLAVDAPTGRGRAVASMPLSDPEGGEGSHQNAIAAWQGYLYVYLGDTNQLFAFEVQPGELTE